MGRKNEGLHGGKMDLAEGALGSRNCYRDSHASVHSRPTIYRILGKQPWGMFECLDPCPGEST